MKTLVIALGALPFVAGVAAGQPQPLNDRQMDQVSAGSFSATAIADAHGYVGRGTVLTETATLSLVGPYAVANGGQITWTPVATSSPASAVRTTTILFQIPGLGTRIFD